MMIADQEPLTLHDRCDACNAPAQTRWSRGTRSLTLCGHHSRQHRDGLTAWADSLHDSNAE